MEPKPLQYSLFQLLLAVAVAAATFGFTRAYGEFFAGLIVGLLLIPIIVRVYQVESVLAGGLIGISLACAFAIGLDHASPQPWHTQIVTLPIYGLVGCLLGAIRAAANAIGDSWPHGEES